MNVDDDDNDSNNSNNNNNNDNKTVSEYDISNMSMYILKKKTKKKANI